MPFQSMMKFMRFVVKPPTKSSIQNFINYVKKINGDLAKTPPVNWLLK